MWHKRCENDTNETSRDENYKARINILDGFADRIDITGAKISKLKDKLIKII